MSQLAIPRMITRPRLVNLFRKHLSTTHIFLSAPGGYGKSVALRAFLTEEPHSFLLSLTKADTDPSILRSRLEALLDKASIILIDDIHVLEGAREAIPYLKEQLEQRNIKYLMSGRHLPFETSTYVVQGKAILLSKDVLAFNAYERSLLLEKADLMAQSKQLKGWPLALSLLSRLPEQHASLPAAETHIFQFLADSVFAQLPEELLEFMKVTAVPLQFDKELASILFDHDDAGILFEEIQTRNLYLQTTGQDGYFKYHDLVRDYLLQELAEKRQLLAEKIVDWYLEQDDLHSAIEHAIDANLEARKEELILKAQPLFFHTNKTYLTYKRWVLALPEESLARHPILCIRLGNLISNLEGSEEEAKRFNYQGEVLAEKAKDFGNMLTARANRALFHYNASELSKGYELIQTVLEHPECKKGVYSRLFALRIATLIIGDMGRIADLPPYFNEVIEGTRAYGAKNEPFMNLGNKILFYLLPTGRFKEAEEEMNKVLKHFKNMPGWLGQYLIFWCEKHVLTGDWTALEKTLKKFEATTKRVGDELLFEDLWETHYKAILAIARTKHDVFDTAMLHYENLAAERPVNKIIQAHLHVWMLKQQEHYSESAQIADDALALIIEAPYHRAQLALERDTSLLLADKLKSLHPETLALIKMRARPHLVRLRALIAVHRYQKGQTTWRKHFKATVKMLELPCFETILQQRDPKLGLEFWKIGLIENLHLNKAKKALFDLADSASLLPLLEQNNQRLSEDTLELLAYLGNEATLPELLNAEKQNQDKHTKNLFHETISIIENKPPPELRIQLMGTFSLRRGNELIQDSDWPRPIVTRLFQYFALQLGKPLTKEQIIEDLWPDTAFDKAWKTFRSVYSLLRKVLEPYMPPKATNRYIHLQNDSYLFESTFVDSDWAKFEQIVRTALRAPNQVTSTVSLGETLENYAPILQDLSFEDWLLEPRQRAQDLYIEGSLHLAKQYLEQGHLRQARNWSERSLAVAPWLEQAYQISMRAYARMGQRSLALHTYREAQKQLKQELDVEPSELSQWLAQRLTQGESI